MNSDQDAECLWQLVQEVHRRMADDKSFKEIFATHQFDLEYHITDLDTLFTVRVDHGHVNVSRTESEAPAIVMELSSSYFHKMASGSIVVPLAILSKRIKMTLKDREKAAGAFPLTTITQRLYKQVYKEFEAAGKQLPQ